MKIRHKARCFQMAYDKTRALVALAAFQEVNSLRDAPWERAAGVGGGTLRKFRELPERSMTMATYAKLAEGASRLLKRPVSTTEFSGDGSSAARPSQLSEPPASPPVEAPPVEALRAPDAPLPPLRSEMPKDVPVYGTVVGGTGQSEFDFEMNGTVVDYVRRPPRIAGRLDVFAAYVQGDSMMHWRKSGQLIYVEKAKPPSNMDYVLVELKPRGIDGTRPALVKQLLAVTPTKVRLRQYNPPKDFDLDRRTVLHIYRVMDWDELMGV